MIKYTQGNLLDDPAEALVNTVNEVGVMGKGIALMFREGFPDNTRAYEQACKDRDIHVGTMYVTENKALVGPRWIINFPTKKHWRQPSKMDWIRDGLTDLVKVIEEKEIKSIAVPPLGCGNGGLEWAQVRREIEAALSAIPDVTVTVYEPTKKYQNPAKRTGVEELTPARAMIAEMVRRYSVLGLECSNLEVQKIAWFLSRSIRKSQVSDPLRLNFVANKFGPYADNLRHLLDGLDGSYLHCEKRLADAGPLDLIWFEDSKRDWIEEYFATDVEAYRLVPIMDKTSEIIDGFESPLGMELLATVDWLVTREGCEPTVLAIRKGLKDWPGGGRSAGRRKQKLFDDRLIGLALDRLQSTTP